MDHSKRNTNQSPRATALVRPAYISKKDFSAPQIFLNQRGSALIIGLSFLPLIVGSLLASVAVIWFINAKNELLYTCENGLLKTQQILVSRENRLLQLNGPIESLVVQKRMLKKSLLLARTPVEMAAIKAKLAQLEIQLKVYSQLQQTEIHQAHALAQQQNDQLVLQIKKRLYEFKKQWATFVFVAVQARPARIQLIQKIIDPSALLYTVPLLFEHRQTLQLSWQMSGSSLFPSWLRFLKQKNFSWQDSCSTRPFKKENGLWTSEIGAAASLSKH